MIINPNISLNQHYFQVALVSKGGHNYSTGKSYEVFNIMVLVGFGCANGKDRALQSKCPIVGI